MSGAPRIETVVEDEAWTRLLPDPAALAETCRAAAARLEPAVRGEIALLLTDDERMRALNARFRDKDRATNVLAFPSGGEDGFLGDIALARETCAAEAADRGVALRDHAAHLIVHGVLHLIGYDHATEEQAAVMERRETAVLKSLGIADPYADAVERI